MRTAQLLAVLIGGALFGFGLAWSTMIQPEVVLDFLQFEDSGLLLVLGGAVLVPLCAYLLIPKLMNKPLLGKEFHKHPNTFSKNTIVGSALFGVGWGLAGVCPGPVFAGIGAGNWMLLISGAAMFLGAYAHGRYVSR